MNRNKSLVVVLCCLSLIIVTGCGDAQKYNDLKAQNRIQQDRIESLENELASCNGQLQQKSQELDGISGKTKADMDAKDATIAAPMTSILWQAELLEADEDLEF